MAEKWLSVVIPTYNGKKYLHDTLRSIVAQGTYDLECLVIDDGSIDTTSSIIESFQEKLPIRRIPTKRTGNWVTNTNRAIREATGTYISFLHQDDIWLPDRLSNLKKWSHEYPEIDFFVGPVHFISQEGKKVGVWRCPFGRQEKQLNGGQLFEKLLIQNFIGIPAPFFKKSLVSQIGELDETLWYTADWDFWLRISSCAQVRYSPIPLAAFRVHPASQTITGSIDEVSWKQQLIDVVEKYILSVEDEKRQASLRRIAFFSIQVNSFLAARVHGKKESIMELIKAFLSLSWAEKKEYYQGSRIVERVIARLRAGMS